MFRILLCLLLSLLISMNAMADPVQPLPANKAFVFSTYVDSQDNVVFLWTIAPGYYLYQDKLHITLSPTSQARLNGVQFPRSTEIQDLMGNSHPVYTGLLKVTAPMVGFFRGPITLEVSYQGCSLSGFCYTPVKKYFNVNETPFGKKLEPVDTITHSPYISLFDHHNLFFIVISFLGLGLLLAFTPCVLPVIPILSSIILGQKRSPWHSFALSLTYVFGMSITYAIAGIIVAKLGQNAQLIFQKPWVIVSLSGLFILLALSLFGLFDLRLPGRIQRTITEVSMKQKGGTYAGVFFMGCLSTLIVSPCVSPPLVGVLAYVAQTGNMILGATALLALGFGMGIPLLLIGASAGKWLPKSGHWMDWLRKILSLLMVGVACWMLSRVFSVSATLLIFTIVLCLFGIYSIFWYEPENPDRKFFQWVGALIGFYGIVMFLNVLAGNIDMLRPWVGIENYLGKSIATHALPFSTIKNMESLDQALLLAKNAETPVMIDFYADWCGACVIMDKMVFSRADVASALRQYKLLRLDVTDDNAFDQAVMQRFNVIAPPAILFFDREGKQLTEHQITGEVDAPTFLKNLKEIEEPERAK